MMMGLFLFMIAFRLKIHKKNNFIDQMFAKFYWFRKEKIKNERVSNESVLNDDFDLECPICYNILDDLSQLVVCNLCKQILHERCAQKCSGSCPLCRHSS